MHAGLANHLAWTAATAMGRSKRMVDGNQLFTITHSVGGPDAPALPQHDLGRGIVDALSGHRRHGGMEQPSSKAVCVGTGDAGGFLPLCVQKTKPGLALGAIAVRFTTPDPAIFPSPQSLVMAQAER